MDTQEYDLEKETAALTAANRKMLEERIPARLNVIYGTCAENRQESEPWRLALTIDLVQSVERNCQELLETIGKLRLPASAWIARNLLEVWVWIKYCGVSKANAWCFHEDALRDMKGLTEIHQKLCDVRGIENETATTSAQRIKDVALEKLGLQDIDSKFLDVANAAKAEGVDLSGLYAPNNRFLSKFAHPTAGLVHGIMHQADGCRQMQAVCTTQGVHFAAQSIIDIEAQLGIQQVAE